MSEGPLAQDIDFLARRRWPGRTIGFGRRAWLTMTAPEIWLLAMYRLCHWRLERLEQRGGNGQPLHLRLAGYLFGIGEWIGRVRCKSEVLAKSSIEPGVCLPRRGFLILGARRVGSGTVIGTRTTVGMRLADGGVPEIGRNVWIGEDCVVYGPIQVGDGVTLLPGTVLSRSVPPGVVLDGNPARVVRRDFDNHFLRMKERLTPSDIAQARSL
ncbi:MAG: hypothetical protein U1F08_02485 [Steroidobacteraceae bacterium]